jgi:IS30 family transposase
MRYVASIIKVDSSTISRELRRDRRLMGYRPKQTDKKVKERI